ncbi:MAG: prepilin peptidase [Candidatus Daviesbacteria bacterium]|nr:prepilin peptidase [Candidatus Daviesbacteria bacterium]
MIVGSAGFLIGIILGSFVKALADRSIIRKSFWGRSYCPKCRHKLAWYDLVPILSFISLKGKCRYCHKKIGIEYVLVEVGMGILIGFLFWQTPFVIARSEATWQSVFQSLILLADLLSKTFFITVLAILFLTDLKKMLIPDRIIVPGIIFGVILNLATAVLNIVYLYYALSQTVIGRLLLPPKSDYFQRHVLLIVQPFFWSFLTGAAIGGFFLSLIILTRGKGMGGGDVKLGAFMGVMLGFPQALFALVLSFLTGAVFSIGLILLRKKHFGQTIPFGPFLSLGSLIMIFWGREIINWYLHLGA